MDRRRFVAGSVAAAGVSAWGRDLLASETLAGQQGGVAADGAAGQAKAGSGKVAVLLVDMDRVAVPVDRRIYGQFLEHINHSVEDGLFAEQIRGAGFEGTDFKTYWESFAERGRAELVDVSLQNGSKSVRLVSQSGLVGIRQGRVFLDKGVSYEGSMWVKWESGEPRLTLRVLSATGQVIWSKPLILKPTGGWQELPFAFTSTLRDTQAVIEMTVAGIGALLVDFVSMMRADARRNGMLRPDLLESLRGLQPSFIRWPGGSFASTYKWREGIGPYQERGYHPNTYWGGYSDYYGFGTHEFLGLCAKLGTEPLIVLAAPGTKDEQVEDAMDWVRYLNDPPTTKLGALRAANGRVQPYGVKLFQIDNEPMNNGFTAQSYAEIVNVYGSRLRDVAPGATIVACGQKRSNDMAWSEAMIDLAGKNFDVLGCHNYEYEPENFETGILRLREYLTKLVEYVRVSQYPKIKVGVLEWSLQHTYDWRAGLHAAGSLMMYEALSPGLTMTCPALLMRNTTDDPTWTASIYHDHVGWFPGGSYAVEKLFREHYAEKYLGSATGVFRDIANRKDFFDKVSTMKPEGWEPEGVDAIATASLDGRRVVVKAVNYRGEKNTLLVRLKGASAPTKASAILHTITARLNTQPSMEKPDAIGVTSKAMDYSKEFAVELEPYTVAVVEIRADA